MKRGLIELMVLSALVLQDPIINAMKTNQFSQPVSGPTDPLPPKPFPPPPSPGPPEPKPPNQLLRYT
jgi:hypothetical protein